MRSLLFAFILTGSIPYVHALNKECVGNPKDPVQAVYLAGEFFSEGTSGPRQGHLLDLESRNRQKLAELAWKKGIRIAIPLPPFKKKMEPAGIFYWNSIIEAGHPTASMEQIEELAQSACGTPLTEPKVIIGYSNGGNMARLACRDSGIRGFAKVFAMDYNNSGVSSSGCSASQLVEFGGNNASTHEQGLFAGQAVSILERGLSGLRQQQAKAD